MLPHTSANMSEPPGPQSAPKVGAKRQRKEGARKGGAEVQKSKKQRGDIAQSDLSERSIFRLNAMKTSDEACIKLMQKRTVLLGKMIASQDFTQHMEMMPELNALTESIVECNINSNSMYTNQKKAVGRQGPKVRAGASLAEPMPLVIDVDAPGPAVVVMAVHPPQPAVQQPVEPQSIVALDDSMPVAVAEPVRAKVIEVKRDPSNAYFFSKGEVGFYVHNRDRTYPFIVTAVQLPLKFDEDGNKAGTIFHITDIVNPAKKFSFTWGDDGFFGPNNLKEAVDYGYKLKADVEFKYDLLGFEPGVALYHVDHAGEITEVNLYCVVNERKEFTRIYHVYYMIGNERHNLTVKGTQYWLFEKKEIAQLFADFVKRTYPMHE